MSCSKQRSRGLIAAAIAAALPLGVAVASSPPPPPGCPITSGTFVDVPLLPIPATAPPNVVTSTIFVAGMPPYIWDVDVRTFIRHTNATDLDVTIQSPLGTVVTLTTDNGGANDDVYNGTLWDDQANPGGQVPYANNNGMVNDHLYANLVVASPLVDEDALAVLIGENPNGVWRITISDDATNNGGQLDRWELDINALDGPPDVSQTTVFVDPIVLPIAPTAPPQVISSTIVVAGLYPFICDVDVVTRIVHTFGADIDMTIMSPQGTVVTLTTDNGGSNDNVFNGTLWNDSSNPGGQVPYLNNNGLATDHLYANLVVASPLTPEDALAEFIGENPNGLWTITISDDANLDGGSFNGWELIITTCYCTTGPPPHRDYLYTGQPSYVDLGEPGGIYPPIPPDFFDPGSEPFDGLVQFCNSAIDPLQFGNADTIVRRSHDPIAPSDPPGTQETVPIEMVALSLASCDPITVTYNNGNPPQLWDLHVTLSDNVPQPTGGMSVHKTHPNGGVFQAFLPIQVKFIFTQVGNPGNIRMFDTGGFLPPLQLQINDGTWSHFAPPALDVVMDADTFFIPGLNEVPERQLFHADALPDVRHAVCPAFRLQACCLPDGSCVMLAPPECQAVCGRPGGPGSICATTHCPCRGDIDGDFDVDLTDLSLLLARFGIAAPHPLYLPAADINCDGAIGLTDLAQLLAGFGLACP